MNRTAPSTGSKPPTQGKLRKSARTYHKMLRRMDKNPRSESYRETLSYLRTLYAEFGRSKVREAIECTKP